jgi:hypothetical protein
MPLPPKPEECQICQFSTTDLDWARQDLSFPGGWLCRTCQKLRRLDARAILCNLINRLMATGVIS